MIAVFGCLLQPVAGLLSSITWFICLIVRDVEWRRNGKTYWDRHSWALHLHRRRKTLDQIGTSGNECWRRRRRERLQCWAGSSLRQVESGRTWLSRVHKPNPSPVSRNQHYQYLIHEATIRAWYRIGNISPKVCGCYSIRFPCSATSTQPNSWCVRKSVLKYMHKPDWKSEVHDCWFLNWVHRSSRLCSLLNVECLLKSEDILQSLLNHVSLWCLLFDTHQTTYQSNLGIWLRKRAT